MLWFTLLVASVIMLIVFIGVGIGTSLVGTIILIFSVSSEEKHTIVAIIMLLTSLLSFSLAFDVFSTSLVPLFLMLK